jgi:hypothetical protein
MKKILFGLLVILIVLMPILNPSEMQHRDTVIKSIINEKTISDKLEKKEIIGRYFNALIINKLVESIVYRENYFFLSLTKVSFEGNSKTIGIGILGSVYIFSTDDVIDTKHK